MKAIFEYKVITDKKIPVIVAYTEEMHNAPMVLLNHGTGGDAEGMMPIAMKLAERGLFCVMIDSIQQGRRLSDRFYDLYCNPDNRFEYKSNYINMLKGMQQEMSMIIDYFDGDGRVDTSRAGITGESQGGYVSFMSIVHDKRIIAAAPMIGSPDLRDRFGNSPGFEELDAELQAEIERINPLFNYEKIYPTALLVQNGNADDIVPVTGVQRLDAVIKDLYRDRPEDYKYIEYDNMGHYCSPEMKNNVVDWLAEKLLRS